MKHFPLAYTCLGDGADAICDLQKTQTLPDESLKEVSFDDWGMTGACIC